MNNYVEKKNIIPWKRLIMYLLMFIFSIVLIIFIVFLIKPSDKKLSKDLLEASKTYVSTFDLKFKDNVEIISLEKLEKNGLLKISNYSKCDLLKTNVKVTKNENDYNYEVNLSCEK